MCLLRIRQVVRKAIALQLSLEPPTFYITATNTDESTCNDNDATITTSVIGGQAEYTYYLEGPITTTVGPTSDVSYTFTALTPGTYTTYVVDDRECTSNEVMLSISDKTTDFSISLSVTEVSCLVLMMDP